MTFPGKPPLFLWNAEDYHQSSPAQRQWAQELIGKLQLRGNEHVLDIGCGDGKVTAEIAQHLRDGRVVGIDASSEMIRFASDHFPPDRYPNLAFTEMAAQDITFREGFDVVFSNAALHWVPDHRPVLAGIGRALRPGGRLLIQMGGRGNAASVFEAFETLRQQSPWDRRFAGFSFTFGFFGPEEYRTWLHDAGLEPVRVELIPKDMAYPSREGFAAWVRTTWLPHLQHLHPDLRPRFIDALYDKYIALYPPDAQGTVHIGMVRLEAEAGKRS